MATFSKVVPQPSIVFDRETQRARVEIGATKADLAAAQADVSTLQSDVATAQADAAAAAAASVDDLKGRVVLALDDATIDTHRITDP